MAMLSKILRLTRVRRLAANSLFSSRGNVLVYVVLVMVIFGVLGVAMLSLFSTSISSSGTRNDTRRAFYMAESGIRYGVSQLRDKDFASKAIDDLNNTTFKLPPLGEFKINVFGPCSFESLTDQSLSGSGILNLKVTKGKIPSGFLSQIPTDVPLIRLVNLDYINPANPLRPPETGIAQVSGFTPVSGTTFQLSLDDDFVSAKDEKLGLAALPLPGAVQTVTVGGNFDLSTAAKPFFPRVGGAFEIRRRNFSYREARDLGDRIRLIDIQPVSGEKSDPESNIQLDEGLILTSRNYMVTAEGKYDKVTHPDTASFAASLAARSFDKAKSRKPDIEFDEEENLPGVLSKVPDPGVVNVFGDPGNRYLSLSTSGGSFGAGWFKDTRSIGGIRNFCTRADAFSTQAFAPSSSSILRVQPAMASLSAFSTAATTITVPSAAISN